MAFEPLSVAAVMTLLIIFITSCLRKFQTRRAATEMDLMSSFQKLNMLCKTLALALPSSIIFPQDTVIFKQSMFAYWAQQEREVIPACIIRPYDVWQLSLTVNLLKREYDERQKQAGKNKAKGLFAIRSGGHSPVAGAASIEDGVVIDLGFLCEVVPSEDGLSVTVGADAKWKDVYKVLDEKGLAVVGGRNSAVGVGGLTLGGKRL